LINEVVAEITETLVSEPEAHPPAQQMPLSTAEIEIAQTLSLLEQRRDRLKID
jgi:hypothetical protein